MKTVIALKNRWSVKSKDKKKLIERRDGSCSRSDSTTASCSVNHGITFGRCSLTGKYHRNEDLIIPPCPITDFVTNTDGWCGSSVHGDEVPGSDTPFSLFDVLFAAVFDGHGGPECATFVSDALQANLAQAIVEAAPSSFQALCNSGAVQEAFKRSEEDFVQCQEHSPTGACVVATLVHGNSFLVAWLGDCRAVLNSGGNTIQLTTDHRCSNQEEFNRVVQNGGRVINDRVMGVLSPTRAFGDNDLKKCYPGQVIADPSILSFSIEESEVPSDISFLILASDGVFDTLSNERACEIVSKTLEKTNNNTTEAARRLCEAASRLNPDDVSATIIVWNHKQRLAASQTSL